MAGRVGTLAVAALVALLVACDARFLEEAALDCSAEAQLPVILSTLQLFRKEASETEEACCKLCQRHRAIQRFAGHKDGCRSFTWQHDTRDCLLFNPQRNNTASA